jgi:glucokinase
MENELTIGIDLGGTNIKGVLVEGEGNILYETSVETQDDPEDKDGIRWKSNVKGVVESLMEKSNYKALIAGFSAPGLANETNTCISYLPNRLPGLEGFVWKDYLGIETYVINDAHAHLIAESRFGVGQGYKNAVLLTLGTGVGGGVLIDGRLYQGEVGRAGHLGHLSISLEQETSIVGTPGSLENSIGECTIEKRSFGRFHSTEDLVKAYEEGDPFASWVWLKSVEHLARAIVSVVNAFSPKLIILGGGITQAGESILDPLNSFLDVYEWRPGEQRTQIKLTSAGKNTGALGAAEFAKIKTKEK